MTFDQVKEKFPGDWKNFSKAFYIFFYPDNCHNKSRLRYDELYGFYHFNEFGIFPLERGKVNEFIKKQESLARMRNFQ